MDNKSDYDTYGNFSTSAKEFEWYQDESRIEPDKKTADLFQLCCSCRSSSVFSYERGNGNTDSSISHGGSHGAILYLGNVYKRRIPGGEDSVFYDKTEISHTGNTPLSIRKSVP